MKTAAIRKKSTPKKIGRSTPTNSRPFQKATGLVVRCSDIDRKGVFTTRKFDKGTSVYVLKGKEISIPAIERIYLNGFKRISADGYQLSDKRYLFLDAFSDFFNHSCNPTCGITGKSTLVALRDIQPGEEITYDYSAAEWTPKEYQAYDHCEWPMSCRCGESNCRKLITCFPYLPDEVKEKYVRSGILPDHIKRKLRLPKDKTRCLVCEQGLRRAMTR